MAKDYIKIRGARVHNLKNINVDIPKNKFVVITGISGSGKSSLAFDTLYGEGQRRYVESLSAYDRQFLGVMDKPDVDSIEGISPAISIDQRKASHNPRSTVGTITEIYDYLRLLFARIGQPHCPKCGKEVSRQTIDQITEQVLKLPPKKEIVILGPVIREKKGEHQGVLEEIQRAGFVRVRIDGIIYRVDEVLPHLPPRPALRGSAVEELLERALDRKKKHNIEVVVDRLILPARPGGPGRPGRDKDLDKSRLVDSLETALKLGKGIVIVAEPLTRVLNDLIFSEHFGCEECGLSLPELEPRLFSFNSPFGACSGCQGLGEKLEVSASLVIPNPNLTIQEGAIFPWAHASHRIGRQGYFFWQLQELAERYRFSLDEPVKNLPKKILDIILFGSASFEGVIPSLERRYHQTDSDYTRKEIEQYMIEKKCEQCQGKRLKPEVLAVTVAGYSIDQIVEISITGVKKFFEELIAKPVRNKARNPDKTLNNNKLKIALPIIKGIINRLQFLIDVGLDYLTLDRKAGTLAGGEEQTLAYVLLLNHIMRSSEPGIAKFGQSTS